LLKSISFLKWPKLLHFKLKRDEILIIALFQLVV
jgi:hypothetical protein